MNILLTLTNDSELICYESIALAFVLASFDHHVQLRLMPDVLPVLKDKKSRLYGMIQSLELYDLPKAWIDDLSHFTDLPHEILTMLVPTPPSIASHLNADTPSASLPFDSILVG